MRGVAGIALAVFFMSTNLAMAADSTMKANMPAQAQTVKGTTKETLLPARWPQFVAKDISWNAECGEVYSYRECRSDRRDCRDYRF
jgi:hypothetical protein